MIVTGGIGRIITDDYYLHHYCNQWPGQLLGWTGQYIEVGDAGGRCGAVGEKGDSGDCAFNRKWPLHFYQLAWKICNLFPNICILYITHNIYCHERYPAYKSGLVRE